MLWLRSDVRRRPLEELLFRGSDGWRRQSSEIGLPYGVGVERGS
jgi:hypothetical protein